MNASLKKLSLPLLRWSLGLVVLWQSWLTFHLALRSLHAAGHREALAHVRLLLSGIEMVAALLFLIPITEKIGGYLLLVIFALAIAIHALHGDFVHETLIVYGAAVLVCLAYRDASR